MKKIKKALLWAWLLLKRNLRKPVFIALMLLIPLASLTMAGAAKGEKGLISVALVCDTDDAAAQRIAARLTGNGSLVRCIEYPSETEAREAVDSAEVDAAWIFLPNASETVDKFVAGRTVKGIVLAVEREDSVFLHMARELLSAAVYPETSYALFKDHLINDLGASADTPDEVFKEYYSEQVADQPIIVTEYADGAESSAEGALLTPIRGVIAVMVVICGLASAMYWYRDEENMTFARLPGALRRGLPFASHLCALLPMGISSVASLSITGIFTDPLRELCAMALLCLSSAAFCELVRKLCRSDKVLGAVIPALTAAMLLVCPVFIDAPLSEPLRMMFPPYLYLKIAYGAALWPMAAVAAVTALFAAAIPETGRT